MAATAETENLRKHKQSFQTHLESLKINCKIIKRDDLNNVRNHLKGNGNDPNIRKKIRKHKFVLANFGSAEDVVCINKSAKDKTNVVITDLLRVACVEEIFDILTRLHYIEGKHLGAKNVYDYVCREYAFIPRAVIKVFKKLCPTCSLKVTQSIIPPLKPIISTGFLGRLQIDLIDMRKSPDRDFKYIGHCVDHFSKYHVLFPMQLKDAEEVASNLVMKVFSYFGLPYILQSDNGREFVNEVITNVVQVWPGKCNIINGNPRKPWVQGVVERYNACVERMISAMKTDLNKTNWADWLSEIQYTLNITRSETTKKTPFEIVFGQLPNTLNHFTGGVIDIEDVQNVIQEGNKDIADIFSVLTDANHEQQTTNGIIEAAHEESVRISRPVPKPRPPMQQKPVPNPRPMVLEKPIPKPRPVLPEKPTPKPRAITGSSSIKHELSKQTPIPPAKRSKLDSVEPSKITIEELLKEKEFKNDNQKEHNFIINEIEPLLSDDSDSDTESIQLENNAINNPKYIPIPIPKVEVDENMLRHYLQEKGEKLFKTEVSISLEECDRYLKNFDEPFHIILEHMQKIDTAPSYSSKKNDMMIMMSIEILRNFISEVDSDIALINENNDKSKIVETSPMRTAIRNEVRLNILKNASKMKSRYSKRKHIKVGNFKVSDNVSVFIPKIDRHKCDMPRLAAVISHKKNLKHPKYKVVCQFGPINRYFTDAELMPYPQTVTANKELKPISLREAAKKFSIRNNDVFSCKCTSGCTKNYCICKKNNSSCTSDCHRGKRCKNDDVMQVIDLEEEVTTKGEKCEKNTKERLSKKSVHIDFPHWGGRIKEDGTEYNFSNTCPIDNWLAILKIAAEYYWVEYENILISSLRSNIEMATILDCISTGNFMKCKLLLAHLNNLLPENRNYNFFGLEQTHIVSHMSFLTTHEHVSVCSNEYCSFQREIKMEGTIPIISEEVKTKGQFEACVIAWILGKWKAPCGKLLSYTKGVPERAVVWDTNTITNERRPYCAGSRAHEARFTTELPLLLPINIEKVKRILHIPEIIRVSPVSIYKLLGVTYQKRRHYGAILNAGQMKVAYDGLKSPSVYNTVSMMSSYGKHISKTLYISCWKTISES